MRLAHLLLLLFLCLGAAAGPAPAQQLEVDDYFRLQRVTELSLSPDGGWLAYVTESGGGRRVQLARTNGSAATIALPALANARRLAWANAPQRLVFLRSDGGTSRLVSYDPRTGALSEELASPSPIISHAFAPDGRTIAFVTQDAPAQTASLYESFRNGRSGLLVDPDTTSSHDFLNPNWNALVRPPPAQLWIREDGRPAYRVALPGVLRGPVFWSSDSRTLSVTFAAPAGASTLAGTPTSLGLFDRQVRRFRTLLAGRAAGPSEPAISYSGGEWIPGEARLLARRVVERDPWTSESQPEWAIVPTTGPADDTGWHSAELYPSELRFFPRSGAGLLVENTVRGEHGLFELSPDGLRPSSLAGERGGTNRLFSFSADFRRAAFVRESLVSPPEIHLSDHGRIRQISDLNGAIAPRIDFRAREVRWRGRDGVEIAGWLLEPRAGAGPRPLVTHVHGGPAFPYPNAFAPYFDYWPYPFELLTGRGYAVFFPNYRGTHTYGRQVAEASGSDAVDDILSGIEQLIAEGIADPGRLALTGHSHGALVGPMAMAQSRRVRAASFAEGVSNSVVMYELMSGEANREIHDRVIGASLYDEPQRYLAESPGLRLRGVSTAALWEGGAYTAALYMLGYAKAAERFGLPSEFIVYPDTGHNIALPHLQREAAVRNLDWLAFWLSGDEDPDPAKAAQYVRWRGLRTGASNAP